MPLLDHFRGPVADDLQWSSFMLQWVVSISDRLNRLLPATQYISLPTVRRPDFLEPEIPSIVYPSSAGSTIPPSQLIVPATHLNPTRIEIYDDRRRSNRLVGVIELVTPDDKRNSETRTAFAARICEHLANAVGVMVVDIVTNYRGCLHNAMIDRLDQSSALHLSSEWDTSAISYRPVLIGVELHTEVWSECLAVRQSLPILPLFLRGGICVMLDLESTYSEACDRLHLT